MDDFEVAYQGAVGVLDRAVQIVSAVRFTVGTIRLGDQEYDDDEPPVPVQSVLAFRRWFEETRDCLKPVEDALCRAFRTPATLRVANWEINEPSWHHCAREYGRRIWKSTIAFDSTDEANQRLKLVRFGTDDDDRLRAMLRKELAEARANNAPPPPPSSDPPTEVIKVLSAQQLVMFEYLRKHGHTTPERLLEKCWDDGSVDAVRKCQERANEKLASTTWSIEVAPSGVYFVENRDAPQNGRN